jgi:hypothetical protein
VASPCCGPQELPDCGGAHQSVGGCGRPRPISGGSARSTREWSHHSRFGMRG